MKFFDKTGVTPPPQEWDVEGSDGFGSCPVGMASLNPVESFRTHLRRHHFGKSAQYSVVTCDSARCNCATGVGRGVGESRSSSWSGGGFPVALPLRLHAGRPRARQHGVRLPPPPAVLLPRAPLRPSTLPFLICRYFKMSFLVSSGIPCRVPSTATAMATAMPSIPPEGSLALCPLVPSVTFHRVLRSS